MSVLQKKNAKWVWNKHDGRINLILGLQVKQCKEGIFINHTNYIKNMLKEFGINEAREIGTPMSPTTKLEKDEKGNDVN